MKYDISYTSNVLMEKLPDKSKQQKSGICEDVMGITVCWFGIVERRDYDKNIIHLPRQGFEYSYTWR